MTTTQTANEQFNSFLQFAVEPPVIESVPDALTHGENLHSSHHENVDFPYDDSIPIDFIDNPEPPPNDKEPPQDEPRYKDKLRNFTFSDGDDLADNSKAPDYQINEILETDTHGLIFGSSQSYKTFVALAITYSVCIGKPFMGYEVFRQGKVIYICGEGKGALSRRLKAIKIAHGGFNNNLLILNESISIDDHTDMQGLKKAIGSYREVINKHKPVLVIFDTFSSLASSTKENDNSEVAQLLKLIKETCSNGVTSSILVLHNGKDKAAGERGASAFRNNVDFSYELSRQGDSMITTMFCRKNKDGDYFKDINMKAEIIPLGIIRQDGKESTSLVLMPCNESENPIDKAKPLSARNRDVLSELHKAIEQHGIEPTNDIKALFPDSPQNIPAKVVHGDKWRDMAYKVIDVEQKSKAFTDCKNQLRTAGKVCFLDGFFWIA